MQVITMKTYRQKLDDETVRLTTYGLSRRFGVYNTVKIVNDRAPDVVLNQIYEENRHDYEIDIHKTFSATIHDDQSQIDIPMYYGFLPYKVQFTIHVPFDATTKLGIYTDNAVIYIFDLCGQGDTALEPGVYDLMFLPNIDSQTFNQMTPAVVTYNEEFGYVNMHGATVHTPSGSTVGFVKVKNGNDYRICPKVINIVGEQIASDGTRIAQQAHVRIFGNTNEAAFGSLSVEVFPMYTDRPAPESEWDEPNTP